MNKKSLLFSFLLLGSIIFLIVNSGNAKAADANAQATNYLLQNVKKSGSTINGTDFKFLQSKMDRVSYTHASYQQYYNGVPVFASYSLVHLNPDNTLQALTNPEVKDYSGVPTSPTVSSETAANTAVSYWVNLTQAQGVQSNGVELVILDKSIFDKQDNSRARLTWKVDVTSKFTGADVFVDALTGNVIYKLDTVYNAVYRKVYDCSVGDIDSDGQPDCVMHYETGGHTYGREEGDSPVGMGVNTYADTDNLYDYVGHSHNYYFNNFGINGANRAGGYGEDPYSLPAESVGLTFIDNVAPSQCPNAFYGSGQIASCEGVAVDDVIYHEYQHAVTENSIVGGLTYQDESGALNEAFSDIFAVAVQYDLTSIYDWIIGEDVNVPGLVGPLRNMQDPTLLEYTTGAPYPDRFYSATYYCGTEDNGGVHVNSSVFNHAVYLMTTGGTFNGCTMAATGMDKVQAVLFSALDNYFTAATDFNAAFTAVNNACTALTGTLDISEADCINIANAMRATEMNQDGACSATPRVAPVCAALPTPTPTPSPTPTPVIFVDFNVDLQIRTDNSAQVQIAFIPDGGGEELKSSTTVDSTGVANDVGTLVMSPGTYDVFIKPQYFLSLSSSAALILGNNCVNVQGEYQAGDFVGDDAINAFDYGIIYAQYGSSGFSDVNVDGIVNAMDFAVFYNNYGLNGAYFTLTGNSWEW